MIINGYIDIINSKHHRTIFSIKCNHEFIISWTAYLYRIKNSFEICTICNPLKVGKEIAKYLPKEYTIIVDENNSKSGKSNHKFLVYHENCKKSCNISRQAILSRISKGKEICGFCNPVKIGKTISHYLPKEYVLLDKNPVNQRFNILHNKCGNPQWISKATIQFRFKNKHEICIVCNPLKKLYSYGEKQLISFIGTICNKKIIENDRKIIKPYELDAYIPELKLAFEYQGDYYHGRTTNDVIGNKTKHDVLQRNELKRKMCLDLGIELIEVWENDWNEKQDDIKSMITENIKMKTQSMSSSILGIP